ncbi:zona pellucida sperm-binding protein 3 [Carassius gibelio]|uniref:zona pellucida sperm-binding protein 3 n=1 Tax=Carassius gibelio TaxID=101364 RepID=UPI002279BEC5|nr:zona pellucida sperm-binding protein 3 [Carassius gibelio]XP_052440523.1 zona pellucida sperm-binding protein 3 [Carassius gibelio]
MTDDWSYERPSNSYFLGDVINVEASVKVYNHVPLRVFVDRCMATQVPDVNALPRYLFIENHGCLVDAKVTASSSRFVPRSQEDKIRFQLEAFMFQGGSSPSIYMTCVLKATLASAPSDALHKSCSLPMGGLLLMGTTRFVVAVTQHVVLMVELLLLLLEAFSGKGRPRSVL